MLTRLLAALALAIAVMAHAPLSHAQNAAPPEKVQELLRLLDDPAVRGWVQQQGNTAPGGDAQLQAPPSDAPQAAPADDMSPGYYLHRRLNDIRQHIDRLAIAVPMVPAEFARLRDNMMSEMASHSGLGVVALVVAFLGLGILAELIYWQGTKGIQHWITGFSLANSTERLRAAGIRLCFSLGFVLCFAIGSIGAFLAFDWPPLLHEIVLGYLSAFLILRIVLAIGRFALAPGGERFRLVPMTTPAAWFWYRRIGVLVGWLCLGWVTVALLRNWGIALPVRQLLAYSLGFILLLLGIEAWLRRPRSPHTLALPHLQRRIRDTLVVAYFVLLWLLWVTTAMPLFWLMVVLVGLPAAVGFIRRGVNHTLRPPTDAPAAAAVHTRSLIEVALDRGLRALLIIGAVFLLAWAWDVDLVAMTMRDTLSTRILRGLLSAVVIILVAEFLWHALRATIDSQLHHAVLAGDSKDENVRRRARLRTLLPILRNVLFIVIFVIAVLMVLSSLGIEIGPLIAGAGVVGVAVGFGAQTLVKDVISGMFYLLDDAFRVGEYIQSGSYKGTVESFSLRSVKLRHHRGPLYTVPFGELGAVQNMSRDWVIDKLSIGVTYDTDLEKARKLIKEIGKILAANPEYAPHIIEPLKMQGVESFGDYKIEIRMKMMTKPGEQFTIRRKALAMIKKAFNENGIEFAQPTVQVAGGEGNLAAAAKQAIDLTAPKPAEG